MKFEYIFPTVLIMLDDDGCRANEKFARNCENV